MYFSAWGTKCIYGVLFIWRYCIYVVVFICRYCIYSVVFICRYCVYKYPLPLKNGYYCQFLHDAPPLPQGTLLDLHGPQNGPCEANIWGPLVKKRPKLINFLRLVSRLPTARFKVKRTFGSGAIANFWQRMMIAPPSLALIRVKIIYKWKTYLLDRWF